MAAGTKRRVRRGKRGGVMAKAVIALVVLGGVGAAAIAAVYSQDRSGTPAEGSLDLYRVDRSTFDITTTASGELIAKNQIEIRSQLESEATIQEIVPEGTVVKQGDILVRLNSDNIQTRIDEAELQIESATAERDAAITAYEIQIQENQSKLQEAELQLDLARLSLQQFLEGQHQQKLADLAWAIERAETEESRLSERLERSEELYKENFLSLDELMQDRRDYREAQANLEKARREQMIYNTFEFPKERMSKESEVTKAESSLERVTEQNKIELRSKEASLANRRRQLEMHEDKLAKLNEQLNNATVEAPSAGLVVYGSTAERSRRGWGDDGPMQIGSQVWPNQLLIVLPDTSQMMATVRVHESLASRIKAGQPATIVVEAVGGRTFNGAVESKGVLAESGGWRDPNLREYTVNIALNFDNNEGTLKPSMRAEAEVRLGRVEDVLTTPVQAVFTEGLVQYVYVPQGAKFDRRIVRVGSRSDRYAAIESGVEAGERVLLRRPDAREIVSREWTTEELAAVGLERNDEGEIVRTGRRGPGGGPGASREAKTEPKPAPDATEATAATEEPAPAPLPAEDAS